MKIKLKVKLMNHELIRKQPILFHNSRCSKSRACLKIVKEKSINFKEFHYLKEGLSVSILNEIIDNLVDPLKDLIRTNEKDYQNNSIVIKNKKVIINFLNKYPICMQRPLFFDGNKFKICRPPETILKFL